MWSYTRNRNGPEEVAGHWKRLLRGVVMAPSLSEYKERLDHTHSNFRKSCKEQGVEVDDPSGSLPTSDTLSGTQAISPQAQKLLISLFRLDWGFMRQKKKQENR